MLQLEENFRVQPEGWVSAKQRPKELKSCIDDIAPVGVTFCYSGPATERLIIDKTAYIAMASSAFSSGPFQPFDHVSTYLKAVISFFLCGVTATNLFRAEWIAYQGKSQSDM